MSGKSPLRSSKLWQYINFVHITKSKVKNLANFRSSTVNFKIALFNPTSNGIRYLKTLIHCLCNSLSQKTWEWIKNIKNRNLLGNPITVRCNGEDICLDYLQAALELEFLDKHLCMADTKRVLEIGAGYGRTAHLIVSNNPIEEYYIIDLDNVLELSQNYLKQVLDESQYSKIHFVSIDNIDLISNLGFNLCINIDSFEEMEGETVRYYLNYIDRHCDSLYVKNPVCNNLVRPSNKGLVNKVYNKIGGVIARNAILPEVIDIFNTDEVKTQVEKYIKVYSPGTDWRCIADAWAAPWSNYWQAIYTKKK